MKLLSLSFPGPDGGTYGVTPPVGVPTGGFTNGEANKVIQSGIVLFLITIIVLCIIFIIWGGITWITSSGEKGKIDKSRKTVIYALIGLIVALSAFLIVDLVGNIFGVKLL